MKQIILEIDDTTETRVIKAAKTGGITAQQWLKNN